MERRFIGLRPTGPDTEVATNSYKKKNTGNVERIRAELFSYKKAKALETRNRFWYHLSKSSHTNSII